MASAGAQPWELYPYQGAGPLHFGMSRDQVIELLGPPRRVLDREPMLVESYPEVQPIYGADGRLVAAHTTGAALIWHGITLTERPVGDVERDLSAAGAPCEPDEDGPMVPTLGIELYAPDEGYWPGQVQGVLVKSHEYEAADPDDQA